MAARQEIESKEGPERDCAKIGCAVHTAVGRGLVIGRQVKLGIVRGIVIGYNIARRGRYPGARYPLLVKTELGIAKCRLDEVVPV
jgi:hypothetical protein